MNTSHKDIFSEYVVLKRYQFIGGIVGLFLGLILALSGNLNLTKVEFIHDSLKINIVSGAGVLIMLLSCAVIWRSGGGIHLTEVKKGDENSKTFSVDPSRGSTGGGNTISCPECGECLAKEQMRLHCTCDCGNSWEQRVPSVWLEHETYAARQKSNNPQKR